MSMEQEQDFLVKELHSYRRMIKYLEKQVLIVQAKLENIPSAGRPGVTGVSQFRKEES
tara:strand:- start:254 stop:427 length:174 start_codon:yes stop_codon:yes gene_type:complete